jgi:hypothetical protein
VLDAVLATIDSYECVAHAQGRPFHRALQHWFRLCVVATL